MSFRFCWTSDVSSNSDLLLKFRTLLSICLPRWFLGTPLKWFTLSCSSVRIVLTLFLLQPQHPASWYCSAWVDPASMEHPSICLLEQCCLALRFFTKFLSYSIFEKRGYLSIFIEIISFLFTSVKEPSSALFSPFTIVAEYLDLSWYPGTLDNWASSELAGKLRNLLPLLSGFTDSLTKDLSSSYFLLQCSVLVNLCPVKLLK